MKGIKILIYLFAVFLSSCEIFLGPNPDSNPQNVLFNLWNDFNNIHAYLDIRVNSDNNTNYDSWHEVYYKENIGYKFKVKPDTTDSQLFDICANMLSELNDSHVVLYSPGRAKNSYTGDPENNKEINFDYIYERLTNEGNKNYDNFIYDTFKDNPCIGYIYIKLFTDENLKNTGWEKEIDNIINGLADTEAIVLDVRDNRGGNIYIQEYIASRFVSVRKNYLKTAIKNGPGNNDYSSTVIHSVYPANNRYTKNIILLTNKNTISAAECFTIALKTQDHVTHIGKPSRGALSVVSNRTMINGWYYSISAERVTDMQGECYEGKGVSPDPEYDYNPKDDKFDNQLKEAVRLAADLSGCTCK